MKEHSFAIFCSVRRSSTCSSPIRRYHFRSYFSVLSLKISFLVLFLFLFSLQRFRSLDCSLFEIIILLSSAPFSHFCSFLLSLFLSFSSSTFSFRAHLDQDNFCRFGVFIRTKSLSYFYSSDNVLI